MVVLDQPCESLDVEDDFDRGVLDILVCMGDGWYCGLKYGADLQGLATAFITG